MTARRGSLGALLRRACRDGSVNATTPGQAAVARRLVNLGWLASSRMGVYTPTAAGRTADERGERLRAAQSAARKEGA